MGARAERLARAARRRAAWDERASYLPLDAPKPVAADIWVVDGAPVHPAGMTLPVRMTVIRLSDGGLLLHSPTQLGPDLAQALAALGPVSDLVAPNIVHWTMLREWQQAFPSARLWAAPNLLSRRQVRQAGLRWDGEITPTLPQRWQGELEHVIVPGGLGFREVAFLHKPSRTAVLTDLVLNVEPARCPPPMRPFARLVGIAAPDGRAAAYLRLIVRMGGPAAMDAAQRIVDWAPERVVFSHGAWFDHDATPALRRSLRWLLPT